MAAQGDCHSGIAGLARAIPADIARAGEAVRHAKRGRIHTFVSTSPIHLAHQMRKTQDEVLEIILKTVAQARDLADRAIDEVVEEVEETFDGPDEPRR